MKPLNNTEIQRLVDKIAAVEAARREAMLPFDEQLDLLRPLYYAAISPYEIGDIISWAHGHNGSRRRGRVIGINSPKFDKPRWLVKNLLAGGAEGRLFTVESWFHKDIRLEPSAVVPAVGGSGV